MVCLVDTLHRVLGIQVGLEWNVIIFILRHFSGDQQTEKEIKAGLTRRLLSVSGRCQAGQVEEEQAEGQGHNQEDGRHQKEDAEPER